MSCENLTCRAKTNEADRASSILEILATMGLLSIVLGASLAHFNPHDSLLPLRLDSLKVQALLRQSVAIAQTSGVAQKVVVSKTTIKADFSPAIQLSAGASVSNPIRLSIYPTRIVSPYTLVLASKAGQCRITLSLHARIKADCLAL